MIRWLTDLLEAATERRLRDFLLGVSAVAAVALFAVVSLGFGTFAAYVCLRASQGHVAAALIICVAYGLLAITILAIRVARRRRARRLRLAARASALASPENIDSLLENLVAAGAQQDQLALVAAMRLGRELSTMQLLALALVGGFIAGRKLTK
jgi:hypothetical protein